MQYLDDPASTLVKKNSRNTTTIPIISIKSLTNNTKKPHEMSSWG